MRAAPLLLAAILALPAIAQGNEPDGGRWEIIGEDGAIFVPDEAPGATVLPPPGLGAFHDHAELTTALQALAANYPSLVTLTSLGDSVEGRALWSLTLRAGPAASEARPAVLFDGAHHGDEVIASEILYRYAEGLVSEYPTTARSRSILENTTLVIVPMVNPDGVARAHNSSYYATARKNAHGVDLNRNYASTWGGPGASTSPSAATYRGPTPASEPETKAMQQLLASRNWTFYSSLHSGAEMILWPYGHTTSPPPESATYGRLGDELSAITGAPDGQVSVILYSVSGDSMDHAYISAGPYWKPLSTSPETYEGSGNAYDWWLLFNPPDNGIGAVVDRWTGFLDHLAKEAAYYGPPALAAPPAHVGGGVPFSLATSITTPLKRPFVTASPNASMTVPAFLGVTSTNPIPIGALNGTTPLSWTIAPVSGGEGLARLRLGAGVAGNLTTTTSVKIIAPAIQLALDKTNAGSGEAFTATVTASSDAPLTGTARLTWQGSVIDTRAVVLNGSGAQTWTVALNAGNASAGTHPVRAQMDYTSGSDSGTLTATKTIFVDRPQLALARAFPNATTPGALFVMTVTATNVGTMPARDVRLQEIVPVGYALWPRAITPADPLASPPPTRANVTDENEIALEWDVAAISPGGEFTYRIGLRTILPGEHALVTSVDYRAQYATYSYAYEGNRSDVQRVSLV